MILKSAVKYKILQYCLENLFNTIQTNFKIIKVERPKFGISYSIVKDIRDNRIMRNFYAKEEMTRDRVKYASIVYTMIHQNEEGLINKTICTISTFNNSFLVIKN